MTKRFVLGVDSGTSLVKVLLADLEGNELGVSVESTPVETPRPGWSEFDLIEDWNSVAKAIRAVLAKNGVDPDEILAVGVTGKGWGCCFLGKDGRPARKGILWNDARAADYIEHWASDGTLSEAYRISGNYYYSGDCAPVTRWVVDNEPEVVAQTESILFPPASIVFQLTGNIKLCHGDVPSLVDIRRKTYSKEIFDLFGISGLRQKFPLPTSSSQIAGQVTREASAATGLKEGTPVVLAECDVSSCATGLGVMDDGEVGIIVGTAHVVSICQAGPTFGPETGTLTVLLPYVDGKYLKLTGPSIATPNLDWYVDNFGEADRIEAAKEGMPLYDYLDSRLMQIPPGCDGIVYHPYLSPGGERAPIRKPTAKGNFFGLDLHHSRHHLLRSIYEGVAFSALDCVQASKVELKEIALSGGGSKSGVWCQIEADIMGCPVKVPAGAEHGARGAIITTMVAMGIYPSYQTAIGALVKTDRTYEPNLKKHQVYQQIFDLYRNIRTHLMDDWDHRAVILADMVAERAS
ncbi:MAG: FGGY-family carbohydrate kinase [Anaerolineales bacterium]|jgi:sugar (pentulose or hexulose) kinase